MFKAAALFQSLLEVAASLIYETFVNKLIVKHSRNHLEWYTFILSNGFNPVQIEWQLTNRLTSFSKKKKVLLINGVLLIDVLVYLESLINKLIN